MKTTVFKKLAVAMVAVMGLAQGVMARTAQEIKSDIDAVTAGNNLNVQVSGNTVTVTGTMTGAPSGNANYLTLNIDAGVTVRWQASLSGQPSSNYSLIRINDGSGTFQVESGSIENTGTGRAITDSSTGVIRVQGSARISSKTGSGATIYLANSYTTATDRLVITNGMVENTGNGDAIRNYSTGAVYVSGGTISAVGGVAIHNYNGANRQTGTVWISGGNIIATGGGAVRNEGYTASYSGTVTISGGTVEVTTGNAVSNYTSGTVTISGGTVRATTTGTAIYNSSGTVTISGSATNITSVRTTSSSGTVYNGSTLNVNGGTVQNTAENANGNAIYNSAGTVNVSNGTVKSGYGNAIYNNGSGKVNISGGTVTTGGSGKAAIYGYSSTSAGTGNSKITGGTVSTTANDGYAVYYDVSYHTLTLGNSPTINGRIYTYPQKLDVIVEAPDIFNPGPNTFYTLDFPTAQYVETRPAVMEGYSFLGSFTLYNPDFALILSGRNLAIALSVKVIFSLNGGTGTAPATVGVYSGGKLYYSPSTNGFTRAGYHNGGKWCTNTAGTSEFIFGASGTTVNGNITLYLKWIPSFTITFNLNGGSGSANGTTGADSTLATLPTPTKTGYTFGGWYTATTGGTQVTTARKYTAAATIYAQWTPITYTIAYELNGGTDNVSNLTSYNIESDAITLHEPSKAGYFFEGWYGSASFTGSPVASIPTGSTTGNKTYYAKWSPIYTVTFNADDGTVYPASAQTVSGSKLADLPTPTRDGYFFEGWFTEETGGTAVNTSKVYDADTEIYAQWSPVYTVTFDADGGTVDPASAQTGSGSKLTSLPTAAKAGYGFTGWFTEATNGTHVTLSHVYTENTTIYAQWTANIYTVSFNLNGITGTAPANIAGVVYGSTLSEGQKPSTAGFTRSGYANDGKWYTRTVVSLDTTYTEFVFGDEGTPVQAATTLYLKWTPTYTVSFSLNGGTGTAPASVPNVVRGSTLSEGQKPATAGFTRSGYVNDGKWYTDAAGTTEFVFGTTEVIAATTLYLKWLQLSTVTFDTNIGGTIFEEGFEGTNSFTVVNYVSLDSIFLSEDFEGATSSFSFANGNGNRWYWGASTSYSGSYSAYIATSNGTANSYDVAASSIVHMYRYVTFPASTEAYTLRFYWKGMGESNYDDLNVRLVETSTSIAAGSTPSGTSLGTFRGSSTWQQATVSIPASNSGTMKRLVFTWRNDGSAGTQPPIAVDNITISKRIVSPNRWYVGTDAKNAGTRGAYIATSSGTTNAYTVTSPTVVHMYRDVTFPISSNPNYTLSFYWRGVGEIHNDYLSVNLVETSVTPTAGTMVSSGTLLGNYWGNTAWNPVAVSIPASNSGTTKRLVFTWRNNASGGTTPPIAVDNIVLRWLPTFPAVPTVNVVTGSVLNTSQIPIAHDFTHIGCINDGKWYTDAAGTTEFDLTTPITSNKTLYLKWAPANTYAVNFNLSGGTGTAPYPVHVKLDNIVFREDFEGPNSFTVVNGSANRWYVGADTKHGGSNAAYIATSSGTTNAYTLNSTSTVHMYRDVELRPSAEPCTLSFYWKGLGEADYDYLSVHVVDASTPVSSGTVPGGLLGTYYGGASWQLATVIIPAEHNGAAKRIVFTWRNDNGYGDQPPIAVDDIVLREGGFGSGTATVTPPSTQAFAKTGYYTDGNWYTRTGTEEEGYDYAPFVFGGNGTLVRGDMTLYLNWLPRYKVSFDLSGGSGTVPANIYVTPPGGDVLTAAQKPSTAAFTRTGYFFHEADEGKWYTRAGTEENGYEYDEFVFGEDGTPVTGDVTLYLIWTPYYKVSFNLDGGSGAAPANIYITPPGGEVLTAAQKPSTEGFARTGYFLREEDEGKWYTLSGAMDDVYTEFVFGEEGIPITGDVALYLKWTPRYRISFNLNGGTGTAPDNVYVTPPGGGPLAGAEQPSVSKFARTDYFLQSDKWYTRTGTSEANYVYTEFVFGENDGTPVTGDVALYLKWTPLYSVSFDSDGGTGSVSYTVFHEDFEGSAHLFTLANGSQTNKWVVGTVAAAAGGSKSAYISNDGGASNGYRTSATSAAHMYRAVTFPTSPQAYTLKFDWQGMGESGYDDLKVYLADTSYSIIAGTAPSGTLLGTYQGGSGWQQASVSIPASNSGTTKHLIFTWRNNNSGGTQPPIAVDNIVLTATGVAMPPVVAVDVFPGKVLSEEQKLSTAAFTKTGYSNDGKWHTRTGMEESGYHYTEFAFGAGGTPVTDDAELYLKWTINSYTVTFVDHDGTQLKQETVEHGSGAAAPHILPPRTGYTFTDWDKVFDAVTGDLTVTALYQINSYVVTFVGYDGAQLKQQTVNYGGYASAPSAPNRTGYAFSGWDAAFNNIVGDLTVTALYAVNSYTVTFYSGSGSAVSPQTVEYGGKVTEPDDPTQKGYNFDGWFKELACVNAWDFGVDVVGASSLTLYAKWTTLPIHVVSFNSEGGSAVGSEHVEHGSNATTPAAPTRAGYTFVGWYGDVQYANAWDFATAITSAVTLYAKWTINEYTVTFVDWNGTQLKRQTVEYGSGATAPASPTRTGYTFIGWDKAFNAVPGDLTVTAVYEINSYAVTFNSQSGSAVAPQTIPYGGKILEPDDPTLKGSNFDGWFKEAACVNLWDFGVDVVGAAPVTLFAKWTTLPIHVVTFNSEGGSAVGSEHIEHGSRVAEPVAPTRTGYMFSGWYRDAQYTNAWDFAAAVTSAITLYAKWTVNEYTVTFIDWNGTQLKRQTVNYGSGATAPALPTRTGYTFKNWDKAFDDIAGDLTVTAEYEINSYAVTFNSQSGSAVAPQTIPYGGKVTEPADPARAGYNFDGWFREIDCINAWDFGVNVVGSAVTLYAKWTTVEIHVVTFNSEGGSAVGSEHIEHGKKVTEPAAPTREGYTFGGWYRDAQYVNAWDFATAVTSAVTLYAKWTQSIAVLTPDRVIPQTKPNEEATVIAPVSQLTGEFTAGPNPVAKQSGSVNFYRQGKRVANCELRIYDATGNVINKVKINDKALNSQARRIVGSWDLKDKNGRQVSEGTYLVKGVVKTSDGKSEKVSVIIGVR